jgi:hypothetical protein
VYVCTAINQPKQNKPENPQHMMHHTQVSYCTAMYQSHAHWHWHLASTTVAHTDDVDNLKQQQKQKERENNNNKVDGKEE